MAARVDTGPIIFEWTFHIGSTDAVASLRNRILAAMLGIFSDVIEALPNIPRSDTKWTRRPYRRSELDVLRRIAPKMSESEIRRRIRATHFPGKPGTYLTLAGRRFILDQA